MALIFSVASILLILVVCKVIYAWIFRDKKLIDIPGPKGWPLFGNSLQMDHIYPHKTFSKWSKMYGPMFKIKIFQEDAVILNDYESIREMLGSEACSSRPYIFRVHEIAFKGYNDIVFGHFSSEWNENKKLLSRSLNAYGTGLMKIETITGQCMDKLFNDVQMDTMDFKNSVDLRPHIHVCVTGIISTLLYGCTLTPSELAELLELERGITKLMSPTGLVAILDHCPWLRHLPIKGIHGSIKDADKLMRWIKQRLMKWKSDFQKNEQCILHSLVQHVSKITNKGLTIEKLVGMTHNIIGAGFTTSTASLYSLILVLINFPEIQEKMYREIQHVTKSRRPNVSDRQSMPYVKAVMEENLRFSSIAPLAIPHYTWKDTNINGKDVPKGVTLLANIWQLHHDEQYFPDPWKFKPERYLDENGQMVASHDPVRKHNLSFSTGRRVCAGEGLARNRIFLIIANLLQKYRFLPEDDLNIPSCDPREFDSGIVVIPFKYKVKVIVRSLE